MSSSLPHTDRRLSPRKKRSPWLGFVFLISIGIAFGGGYWLAKSDVEPPPIFKVKKVSSAYLAYVHRIHDAGLDSLPLGRNWLAVGEAALADSTMMPLPVQLETFVDASEPSALAVRFEAKEGEMLHIQIADRAGDEGQLFVELFECREGERLPKAVLSEVHLAGEILYEIDNDGIYLLRIQPEMLINLSYRLTCYTTASLAFPVQGQGKDRKAILSFFGAPRDGGRRKHKGVDIFANKGTPILAAADGRVNLRNGGLGGKTVWQRVGDKSLYYAHLDSQYVRSGQRVKTGDTLGTVGNTGNARYTPPHLHFGIYRRRKGAVDPLAFVDTDKRQPQDILFQDKKGKWLRVRNNNISLKVLPNSNSTDQTRISRYSPLWVEADLGKWLKVRNGNQASGYVLSKEMTEVDFDNPLQTFTATAPEPFLQNPDSCAAIRGMLTAGEEIPVYAMNSEFYLTKMAGKVGWLKRGN